MKTKYDELTLTHNLSGVILPTDRYKSTYSKGAYSMMLVIALSTGTQREHNSTKPKENTKPGEMTAPSTKQQIRHARKS